MKQRTNYLKNIIVLKDVESLRSAQADPAPGYAAERIAPLSAEEGNLYIASPDADLKALSGNGIPFVVYVDTLKRSGSERDFYEGAKYVLEGEGEFDEEDFDRGELEKIYRRLNKIPWDILETDRCVIKETSLDDLDEFYAIYTDPDITRFTEDLMERSEEEKYTENYRDLIYEIYGHGIWTVLEKDTGRIIGRAGLDERAGFDTPELGFVIGKPWQNQGFAYEVCSAILNWAADNDIENVMSLTEKENTAAVKLLEKLGFSAENTVNIGSAEYQMFEKGLK